MGISEAFMRGWIDRSGKLTKDYPFLRRSKSWARRIVIATVLVLFCAISVYANLSTVCMDGPAGSIGGGIGASKTFIVIPVVPFPDRIGPRINGTVLVLI